MSDSWIERQSLEPGWIVVGETGNGPYEQAMLDGRHRLTADEPPAVGGGDAGPGPYELLLMALGACTSMTLRMYATRRSLPLERVVVRLRHSKIHAQDCAECEQHEGYLDRIDKQIVVAGSLSPEQVTRLGEIAEKCPVNVTLHQSVHTTMTIRAAGDGADIH